MGNQCCRERNKKDKKENNTQHELLLLEEKQTSIPIQPLLIAESPVAVVQSLPVSVQLEKETETDDALQHVLCLGSGHGRVGLLCCSTDSHGVRRILFGRCKDSGLYRALSAPTIEESETPLENLLRCSNCVESELSFLIQQALSQHKACALSSPSASRRLAYHFLVLVDVPFKNFSLVSKSVVSHLEWVRVDVVSLLEKEHNVAPSLVAFWPLLQDMNPVSH